LKIKPSFWERIKNKAYGAYARFKTRKYILPDVGRPLGSPTFNSNEGGMVATEQPHPDYYNAMVKPSGEVITPTSEQTAEEIASLISQAACDREFPRVIVYPITGERRKDVLRLLYNQERYPLYEYLEANIIGNDDLDLNSIIFKYGGKTHPDKIL